MTNNFYKLLFAIIVLLSFAACKGEKQNAYTITGTVPDSTYNGKTVYLRSYQTEKKIDSTQVAEQKFVFKGTIDTAEYLRLDLGRLYANIIAEAGNITVDMSNPQSGAGTPLNAKLADFKNKTNEINTTASENFQKLKEDKSLSKDEREAKAMENGNIARKKMYEICKTAIKENPNNAVGMAVLWNFSQSGNIEYFDTLYAFTGEVVRQNKVIERIVAKNEKAKTTAEGNMFSDFTIAHGTLGGDSISLSDYVGKGKYILVDFWASWCSPCRLEIPNIKEVYKKYKGDKFDVVSVAVWDKRDKTLKAIEEDKLEWNQIIDAQEIPTDIYGIDGIPHIILFAPDGTILARGLRGEALKRKVAEVMN